MISYFVKGRTKLNGALADDDGNGDCDTGCDICLVLPIVEQFAAQRRDDMNKKKTFRFVTGLFLVVWVLSGLLTSAGAASVEEQAHDSGFSAVLYDNSNGLPAPEANAVAQTGVGFIWIGGYDGLVRYDGIEFKHFDPSSGVSSVNCLYVDSMDRLWVGFNDSGLAVYQDAQFKFWGRDDGLISLSVRALCEDTAGNIIVATTQGMAYIDPDGQLQTINDPRIKEKYVRRLTKDANGVIYGCTMDGCIFAMEQLALTSFYDVHGLGIKDIFCITPDAKEKGKVYLGTGSSEIVCGNMLEGMENLEMLSAAPLVHINDIYPTSDHKIWVCANNGLGYFDETGKYVELKNYPMNNSITSIMEDREGNIWFTSSRQGVMKVVRSPFVDITGISGLDRVVTNTTCVYQGDLYIGTDTGLQLLDKDYNQKENILTQLLDGARIRSIKADSSGNLWLCTYTGDNGLVCYHGDGTYQSFNEASGLVSSKIRTVTELSDGSIAVAASGGVNLIKDGQVTATYDKHSGITNTEILSIIEGDNGSIYFGSDGGGLYILENGELRCLGLDDGLKSQVIMQLYKDPQRDVYWIITSNSIAYIKDEKIHTVSNFPYSNNLDMQFDSQGGIWVLSGSGIYFVNGDNLLEDLDLVYSFYGIHSGLPSIATANSRNYLSPDGILYISGNSGVSSININTAREGKNDAQLVVPFVEIDGKEIDVIPGNTIILSPQCKRITIRGYAMTYRHNPQVSYYLEGFDDTVTTVANHEMKPVSYTNLPSGEYIFHMSIIDIMTGDAVNSIAVRIVKKPAFHEQVWFWPLVVAAVALATVFTIKIYTHRKMEHFLRREREQQVFINQMIQAFAKSVDLKDHYTNGHSFRVADYTRMIAEKSGRSATETERIYNIALMHDIGKLTTPEAVLNKPGRLTDEEYAVMKQHAINGYDILKGVEIAPELALGAGYHHERIDGKGYPFGKAADEIPDVAQMIAVADTFDAMHSTRPYRRKMAMEDIIAELKRISGTQLSAEYVQALLTLIEEGKIDD